jgi:hypothetical protein
MHVGRDDRGFLVPLYDSRHFLVVAGGLLVSIERDAMRQALREMEAEQRVREGWHVLDLADVLRCCAKSRENTPPPSEEEIAMMERYEPDAEDREIGREVWDVAAPIGQQPTDEDCEHNPVARALRYMLRVSETSGVQEADEFAFGARGRGDQKPKAATGNLFVEVAKYRRSAREQVKADLRHDESGRRRKVTSAMVTSAMKSRQPEPSDTEPSGLSKSKAGVYAWQVGSGATIYTSTEYLRERAQSASMVTAGDQGSARGYLLPVRDVFALADAPQEQTPPHLMEEYWQRSADERLLLDDGYYPEVIDSMDSEHIRDEAREVRHRDMGEPTEEEWAEINADADAEMRAMNQAA